MEYLLSFLEGIITFISPCILPMFPIYLSYFAGSSMETDLIPGQSTTAPKKRFLSPLLKNVIGFVIGFSLVFTALGTFAGTVGRFLADYSRIINIVAGVIIILFGLHFMQLLRIPFLDRTRKAGYQPRQLGFFSAIVFGIVFSIGWTPCVGIFLGSALMLAASQESILKGTLLLLTYSLGLSLPFLLSAIFVEQLKKTFAWIRSHYRIINLISGILLVVVGLLMVLGLFGRLMAILQF